MRKLKSYFALTCSLLLALGLSMTTQAQEEEPVGWWTFEDGVEVVDLAGNFPDLILVGAEIDDGVLDTGPGAFAISADNYEGPDITEKTMVSWLSLDSLAVQEGSALTIDTTVGDEFDVMVLGERVNSQWMAGSSFFRRTMDFPDAFTEKDTDVPIKLVYTYEDDGGQARITGYRNDESMGSYTMGPIATHTAGNGEVLFGGRHNEGGKAAAEGALDAHIEEGRIYNRVLSVAEMGSLQIGTIQVEVRGKLTTLWGGIKTQ